ncbi:MAG: pyroglutamyl-peptidase I [Firmicutes bacterium]|nr:pyroglutamyl-peptidase I [Bacillota bacterium]
MRVILTGFEPFDGNGFNPSWEAVKQVKAPEGVEIRKLHLPVVYQKAPAILLQEMREWMPDIVICVGLAEGRAEVTPERVAVNVMDETIPDNEGFFPHGDPIDPEGETAYLTKLPVHAIDAALKAAGIPSKISNTAGVYVCNNLMYGLLQAIGSEPVFRNVKGGFIHVPATKEMGLAESVPVLPLETLVNALEIALHTVLES